MTSAPPPVLRDLARLVESEQLGTSLFGTLADWARTDSARRAWTAMTELEVQTNAGVADFLRRTEPNVKTANRVANVAGASGGTGMQLLPYDVQLRAVRLGTRRYLPTFQRLAHHYRDTEEAALFDYIVRHELAIIEFTDRALAKSTGALDPVLRLLERPVPSIPPRSADRD